MKNSMRIGELAARAGVTPRTVRWYEALGLIPQGEREGTGQHRYPEQTVARLNKIEQLKRLGFSLDEVGEVIELYFTDPSQKRPKRKVLAILQKHLAETDVQMAALRKFRSELKSRIEKFEQWLTEAEQK